MSDRPNALATAEDFEFAALSEADETDDFDLKVTHS